MALGDEMEGKGQGGPRGGEMRITEETFSWTDAIVGWPYVPVFRDLSRFYEVCPDDLCKKAK